MRVITFSRYFPVSHPKKGDTTFFPEKILISLGLNGQYISEGKFDWLNDFSMGLDDPKHHTIRAGNRWKVGDKFSPRIWSGKPYASKQIEFAPPIEIKKIWSFMMSPSGFIAVNGKPLPTDKTEDLIKNDGLEWGDFFDWFEIGMKKGEPFRGQILCWNESVEYLPTKPHRLVTAVQECDATEVK